MVVCGRVVCGQLSSHFRRFGKFTLPLFSLGTPCCTRALSSFRINVNTTPEKFKKTNACDKNVGGIESKYVNAAVTMKTEFKVIMCFHSIQNKLY